MYEVNYKSAFLLIRESLPLMSNRKNANIVLNGSYAAYDPIKTIEFYSKTKTMLV